MRWETAGDFASVWLHKTRYSTYLERKPQKRTLCIVASTDVGVRVLRWRAIEGYLCRIGILQRRHGEGCLLSVR